MEFFNHKVVRLKSHLDKYLIADDDQQTVRQSRHGNSRKARWLVEIADSDHHAIRLKSCHGSYLTASSSPFLLGMTGDRVLQTAPKNIKDLKIEWQPIRDGFQVKLKGFGGGYLRGNGGTPPWRNAVTHDNPQTGSTANWILWMVEGVEISEEEQMNGHLSAVSSFSSLVSDDVGSPVSVISGSNSPMSFTRKSSPKLANPVVHQMTAMDLFQNAKAVRLRSHHDKYLTAEEDEDSVIQDRNGSSKNARWSVEFVSAAANSHDGTLVIRLKSCYGKYLTASNQPFLLGMTGRKVLQTLPHRLDSSVEWEPIKEGHNQVKFRTRYGQFLRANGGLPPWRNSVTHDIPHRSATQDWVIWEVDVIDIVVRSPAAGIPPPKLIPRVESSESHTPSTRSLASFSRQESVDSVANSPPKRDDGRIIYYHIANELYGDEEDSKGFSILFKGNGVDELTQRLEEETGLSDITVCSKNPLNGKLYPLRLQLPPNHVTMHVVVVQSSSKVAEGFGRA